MSQANHNPDFDLAQGSRQVALTVLYLFKMIPKNHKQSIIIYTESNAKSDTIDIVIAVVSQANLS